MSEREMRKMREGGLVHKESENIRFYSDMKFPEFSNKNGDKDGEKSGSASRAVLSTLLFLYEPLV